MKASDSKQTTIDQFRHHVSSGKTEFFLKYGMDFVMGKREGSYLYDVDGEKRLFNLHCNGGVFNLGHRNEELIDLLISSVAELDIGNHHLMSRERAELAAALADLMPGDLNYTVFGVGGGEAVDLAIKVARGYTQRNDIISATGGYHGHTGLALAAGNAKYSQPFGPPMPGFRQVPFNDLAALEMTLNEQTAAVILETVPATLGMVIPKPDYLPTVSEICRRNGTLLIIDEVQTGLGRTGKLWGFEHFKIIPDIVVLGKGLSGGIYPISATIIREPLESVFHPDPFIHISTFGGAEVGCRVAKRVLEISASADFLSQVNRLADQFRHGFEMLHPKHHKFYKNLRQLGLMMGLKLTDEVCGPVMTKAAYDHDLLLIYSGNDTSVCQFLPPLNISISQADLVMTQLDGAFVAARRLKQLVDGKNKMQKFWNKLTGKTTKGKH
ncbi:MAG: aspartate aminotransferase family protein [Candidatus Marinimicrobia bacterium]|nr:aspartate aminotransferase family protein [Candidatus Neomarinimicrobiota bacterium]